MEHITRLVKIRLHNLEGVIKQHKYCKENNIAIDMYEENLIKLEKEYEGLKEEFKQLVETKKI